MIKGGLYCGCSLTSTDNFLPVELVAVECVYVPDSSKLPRPCTLALLSVVGTSLAIFKLSVFREKSMSINFAIQLTIPMYFETFLNYGWLWGWVQYFLSFQFLLNIIMCILLFILLNMAHFKKSILCRVPLLGSTSKFIIMAKYTGYYHTKSTLMFVKLYLCTSIITYVHNQPSFSFKLHELCMTHNNLHGCTSLQLLLLPCVHAQGAGWSNQFYHCPVTKSPNLAI